VAEKVEAVKLPAEIYNTYALWKYEAPWKILAKKFEAYEELKAPFKAVRLEAIAARDSVLTAKLLKEAALWEPSVVIALATHEKLQKKVDDVTAVANELVLKEYIEKLEVIRGVKEIIHLAKTVGKTATKICLYNPNCCKDVGRCPPNRITPPLFSISLTSFLFVRITLCELLMASPHSFVGVCRNYGFCFSLCFCFINFRRLRGSI